MNTECCICYESDKNLILLKCSHLHCVCDECFQNINICPLCRTDINSILKKDQPKPEAIIEEPPNEYNFTTPNEEASKDITEFLARISIGLEEDHGVNVIKEIQLKISVKYGIVSRIFNISNYILQDENQIFNTLDDYLQMVSNKISDKLAGKDYTITNIKVLVE